MRGRLVLPPSDSRHAAGLLQHTLTQLPPNTHTHTQAGNRLVSINARPAPTLDRVFGVMNAFGTIAFAFNGAICLMEIQDTLREPPAASVSMKKTVIAS